MTRALLVDDSPSVRAVLRRFLRRTEDIEVVGEASDGRQAVQLALELQPDVILMDLVMPVMDGYTAIEKIMALKPTPILVLSSRANRNQMRIAFDAMRLGAVEVLPKPEDPDSWQHLATTLPETLRAITGHSSPEEAAEVPETGPRGSSSVDRKLDLRYVVVGASTGGPAALGELLEALPVPLPVSVIVVQHISSGFEVGLVEWLSRELPHDVRLAREGEFPSRGAVRVAPSGAHLVLEPDGSLHLDRKTPPRQGHCPSVDELFYSCARNWSRFSAGVLLTGMGSDGVDGLLELRRAGSLTLVQDEASSVVYGMPRAALERGAAQLALPPRELARALARTWLGEDR